MPSEVDDLREHLQRYRAVTLQYFDLLSDADLSWRPRPDAFTCGQQLVHILHGEDFVTRGVFGNDWNRDRNRFPKPLPGRDELKGQFIAVRRVTLEHLARLTDDRLGTIVRRPDLPFDVSIRSWLWFILEHEIHHKGQLAEYLRAMGRVPPYFAIPLPHGERPDIQARSELGGI